MARDQVQANPALDKPAQRLQLAGAGVFGPVLKGLGGKLIIDIEPGEVLENVKFFSHGSNEFSKSLLALGSFSEIGLGHRRWTYNFVFGTDTDYGFTGADPIRNYVQWTINKRGVINPSGALANEKFLADDSDAFRNISDEKLRSNRAYFTSRDYASDSTGSADVSEGSGLCWREDDSTIWVISDDREIVVLNRDLVQVQSKITLPSANFTDPEAIVYMGSDRFAILDEGSFGVRPVRLHLFHSRKRSSALNLSEDLITHDLSDIVEFAGGDGAEGIAYDRIANKFYVGTQPTGDGEGGLWEVDMNIFNTDGEPTQTLLFRWYDILVEPGHLGAGAICGDLFYSSIITGGQLRRSLLCHFRTPDGGGSSDQRQLIQIDIESGLFIDKYEHGLDGKWEGFTASFDREDLYFIREGSGSNIAKHVHTKNLEKQIFRKQFYVKDLPASRGIYLDGQEAQQGEAWTFINPGDSNAFAADATISINVLPNFNDEFFKQAEYEGTIGKKIGTKEFIDGKLETVFGERRPNRWAQTVRNVGGVKTVEVFVDGDLVTPVIEEISIEDLRGYYWPTPSLGLHTVTVRMRSELGSSNYVDITGFIRFRQIECPDPVEE